MTDIRPLLLEPMEEERPGVIMPDKMEQAVQFLRLAVPLIEVEVQPETEFFRLPQRYRYMLDNAIVVEIGRLGAGGAVD